MPALPAFALQRAVSTMIRDLELDYWTGTVYTTNRRVWEHDANFKEKLRAMRCMAIDMETATIFAAGFANRIPCGALLLVSDQPMIPEGVKTEASDARVSADFVQNHIKVGIEALRLIRRLVQLAEDNYVQHRYAFLQIQSRYKAGVGRGVDLEQAGARCRPRSRH